MGVGDNLTADTMQEQKTPPPQKNHHSQQFGGFSVFEILSSISSISLLCGGYLNRRVPHPGQRAALFTVCVCDWMRRALSHVTGNSTWCEVQGTAHLALASKSRGT